MAASGISQAPHENPVAGHPTPSQPTIKKILPQVPDADPHQFGLPIKMIERTENARTKHAYDSYFMEHTAMTEYILLQKQRIPGLYVIPSAGSPLKWFGVLFIRTGIYEGGVFRFTLYIPDNYPDSDCPMLVFDIPIFHPLINIETGELDVKRAFTKWRKHVNHLWQVLLFARRVFINMDVQHPLNPEAAVLYENDMEIFKFKAAKSVRLCHDRLYDRPSTDDSNAIQFSVLTPQVHDDVLRRILARQTEEDNSSKTPNSSGLSWVKPGVQESFSKTVS